MIDQTASWFQLDLMNTALKGQRFRFDKTDPTTGKRDTVEIGGV